MKRHGKSGNFLEFYFYCKVNVICFFFSLSLSKCYLIRLADIFVYDLDLIVFDLHITGCGEITTGDAGDRPTVTQHVVTW